MQTSAASVRPPAALGHHLLIELYGCDDTRLDSVSEVERILLDAANLAGATVVNSAFHHFSPHGVTGVLVIAESHIAAHTWPEYSYAAVDCFTCGTTSILEALEELIVSGFGATNSTSSLLRRGEPEPSQVSQE